ncbi:MAG: PAC2 family protein, partial [Nanoarchaeota archaeon]|nr:PAC2 family protein [Nanoarchaeota archaeon]
MDKWKIQLFGKKPKLNRPVLIEGLPGIGNVGKVAIDFLIDELKAKKLYEITSFAFPHSVFINEDNLVELPSVEIYYKSFGGKKPDLLLLAGDIQPTDEISCYEFSELMLDLFSELKGKEIITLGGIGLQEIPKKPKLYCTSNSKEMIKRYKDKDLNEKIYGVVGPIVGVSGLLVGLAAQRKIDAMAVLAETYAHPLYLGVKGSREILKFLNRKFKLDVDVDKLEKEVEDIEAELIKRTKDLEDVSKQTALKKLS